jgi:lipoprotein-anchoring transpeptidase ErfK/SrfK
VSLIRQSTIPARLSILSPVTPLRIAFIAAAFALGGCSTVSDLLVTNIPHFQEGRASIVVRKRVQEAELYRGRVLVAVSHISTGREGYETPVGRFHVIRKDRDHRSSLYGDYVDADDRIVKANVDVRKGGRPPHSHFLGAPMPFFVEFTPGFGLHAGHLPGYPASHGCVRLTYWKARQFFNESHVGTPVTVRP